MLIAAILFVALFELVSVFVPIALVGKEREILTPGVAAGSMACLMTISGAMVYVASQLHHGAAAFVDAWVLGGMLTNIIFLPYLTGRTPVGAMSPGRAAFNVGRNVAELAGVLYLLTLAV